MPSIVISSGHGIKVRGAAGPAPWGLDEVDEAIRLMDRVAEFLRSAGIKVTTYTDTISTSQGENLERIVDFHNAQGPHDLDVSIHFNAFEVTTTKPMGCECLYVSEADLAADVAQALSDATGLPNRGGKYRSDLAFLNGTNEPAILVETVFVDSKIDADAYRENFDQVALNLAAAISAPVVILNPPPQPQPVPPEPATPKAFYAFGQCSYFGGPNDMGVSSDEGLAFIYDVDEAPHLFLPQQPEGTTGLARRLNPEIFYLACRWNYDDISKEQLKNPMVQAIVRAANGREFHAWPADWGPHEDTKRIADLSPALMDALDITTDDEVEVLYPAGADVSA